MSEETRIILTAMIFLVLGALVSYIVCMGIIDSLKIKVKELKNKLKE
tara:strand:+ start:241 stop:381 length:141 start_codon:yes stop_codon:yes gene_type:complete